MQSQPKVCINPHEKMFAVAATRFEGASFQSPLQLMRRNAFLHVCAPHIDTADPLVQRRSVQVTLECFDIRQLWHRARDAGNRACERSLRKKTRRRRQDCLRHAFCRSLGEAMSSNSIDDFLRLLKKSPSGAVFNPWWELDEQNDVGRDAPAIRRKQLRAYLHKRLAKANVAVIGEAVGYRGGHFSGIPMTSERLLLGRSTNVPMKSNDFFFDINPRRTSKPEKCPDGFSEPTATIVWGTLLRLGLKPEQFVLWNAFPWHSFDSRRGVLSNRMPNKFERAAGLPVLKAFLELFPCDQVAALGKVAAAQLELLNVNAHCIRHPASGGARLFRTQIAAVVHTDRE